jgi:hypothetical protein
MADDEVRGRHRRRIVVQCGRGIVPWQIGRHDVVAAEAQFVSEKVPAPRPVPGAMN